MQQPRHQSNVGHLGRVPGFRSQRCHHPVVTKCGDESECRVGLFVTGLFGLFDPQPGRPRLGSPRRNAQTAGGTGPSPGVYRLMRLAAKPYYSPTAAKTGRGPVE
jgi:hypothetical protein